MGLLSELENAARWDGPEPQYQGDPDGETYGHYCAAMRARGWLEEAKGMQAKIKRLQDIVDKLPKTADGVPVVDGMVVYFRCANGILAWTAYLGPQAEELDPYPWQKGYSTPKALEAAEAVKGE